MEVARTAWIADRVVRGLDAKPKDVESFLSSNQEAFTTFLDRADAGSSLIIFTTVEMVMPPPPTKEQIAEAQAQQAAIAQQQRQQQLMQRASSPPADEQADGENYDPDAAVHDPDAPAPTEVDTSAEDAARAAEIEAAMLSLAREPVPTLKLHLTSQCLPESMVNNLGRTMYFIKNVDKVAPLPEETVQAAMSRSLEYSVLPSQSLFTLESVIKNIYLPIFEPEQSQSDAAPVVAHKVVEMPAAPVAQDGDEPAQAPVEKAVVVTVGATPNLPETVLNEFTTNMQKFVSQISHAIQQVTGDIHLTVPDVPAHLSIREAAGDGELVHTLEIAVDSWTNVISSVLAQENHKQLVGTGPISEINYWRSRNASLSGLYEQLRTPAVKRLLATLEESASDALSSFKDQMIELTKLFEEAKNNVKFLTTLERHFKNIASGQLSVIMDTIPPVMAALKMVWIISRHYNKDERMSLLMQLIAIEIAEKVAKEINIRSIFRRRPEEAMQVIRKGKDVLDSWYRTYMSVREQIEGSDSKDRWDFDKKKLFEQTNYMSKICENLFEVAQTLDQFYRFLGPELKSVTGDSAGIDEVLEFVNNLVTPLENLPFNVFNRQYQTSWEQVMRSFSEKVEEIETRTKAFIDSSFQKLRSAEGAFELLTNFKNIESRASIRNQMMDKFTNILEQYGREVERVSDIFQSQRASPPITEQQPPVAGSILWARSLYHRVKKSIIRFQGHGSLLTTEKGKDICKQYIAIAREITEYEDRLFREWEQSVKRTIEEKLKHFILRKTMIPQPKVESDEPQPSARRSKPSTSHSHSGSFNQSGIGSSHISAQSANSASSAHDSETFVVDERDALPIIHYTVHVNFAPELKQLIREARYLEKLSLQVPDAALNVALQEDGYYLNIERLSAMIDSLSEAIKQLTPEQKVVLADRIRHLGRVLQPGFGPLNWNSLAIDDFITGCNRAIKEFQDIVQQIQKNAAMIEAVMQNVRNARLVNVEDFADRHQKYRIDSLFERIERRRASTVEALVQQWDQTVSQALEKIESLVTGKDARNVPIMAPYFAYWERRMFDALTKMIVSGVRAVHQLLFTSKSRRNEDASQALIQIKAEMNGADIMTSPTQQDLERLGRLPRLILDSARSFVRWMRGTCVRCQPLAMPDDTIYLFTFLEDVTRSPNLMKVVTNVNQALFEMFQTLQKYIESWSSYDQKYGLWNSKRMATLDKNRLKTETCVWFDRKLARFFRLWEGMKGVSHTKTIEFLEIDTQKVIGAIQQQSLEWVQRYGNVLRDLTEEQLRSLYSRIDLWTENINKETNTIEDLKFVLSNVGELQSASMDMELEFDDCIERFRTLAMYSIEVKPSDVSAAHELHSRWAALILESKKRDKALILVKRRFTEITVEQTKKFFEEILALRQRFKETGPGANGVTLDQGLKLMVSSKEELSKFSATRDELVNAEKLFNLPVTSYPDLVFIEQQLDKLERIFACYRDQQDAIRGWASTRWTDLQIDTLNRGVEGFFKLMKGMADDLRKMPTFRLVEEKLTSFQESVPLLALLKNDALRPRHWARLMDVTGVTFDLGAEFTLGKLFAMELSRFSDEVNNITITAQQEGKIERELTKVTSIWSAKNFPMYGYKGNDALRLLNDCSELVTELEDNMMNLTMMANSQYAGHFKDDLRKWERDLSTVLECMDVWQVVQRKWMYLEGIFIGSDDIKAQLPEAAKAFDRVDQLFKKIMTMTAKNPNVVGACLVENRLEELRQLSSSLDKCQKSLSDYLESKRNAFARFFFMSDDELLSILGSSDPTAVQPHMLKMFDNCKELSFAKQNKVATKMTSAENETFEFRTHVQIEGAVEVWMNLIDAEMQRSLQIISKEATFNYANMRRVDWIEANIGMVGLSGSQCWWTWETEDAFRKVQKGDKHAMKKLLATQNEQLLELVTAIRSPSLTNHFRKKINTMIIIDVHAKDIIDRFVRDSILDAREFAWESQLRFYWDKDIDDMIIRQCTGQFRYGYEYMGLNGRLVITPLTDRCYMTLTQALTFHMGGAPAGPAGTGKTETVKDLSKCLANPCMVTNCGEGLDYRAMAAIFSGLVQSGAWGCFDEFNRIDLEVLSVVSAQLQTIQIARKLNKERFEFAGKEIKLNMRCGIFITMNPGYAGRTELPDNLKALFRPVTMIVPDFQNICEISLFSEGFTEAKSLGKKMTVLYRLSQEQLSKQYHYDFGLRALKSVLVMAGAIKRESAQFSEDNVLMRALRDMNLPKFVFEDVPLFLGLINDLFPGLDCPRTVNNKMKAAVVNDLRENGFEHEDERIFSLQVDKIMQLYETMLTRHTSMVVGPTQGGKTVCIETLSRAQHKALGIHTKLFTINPKLQPVQELYGVLDPVTRDWQDGLLSKLFRECNQPLKANSTEKRYIVFDGDVDALWVENMNSVMDDNKILTLPNSERIRLTDHVRLLIEVGDLQYASPATVSRVGMVFVDPKNLGCKPMYDKWIRTRNEINAVEAGVLDSMYERYLVPCLSYVLYGLIEGQIAPDGALKTIIPIVDVGMIKQLCYMYSALVPTDDGSKPMDDPDAIESIFIFCLMWSVGGALVQTSRDRFDAYVKTLSNRSLQASGAGKSALPNDLIYDFYFDKATLRWVKWADVVRPYNPPVPFEFSRVLVPTVDTTRFTFILDRLVRVRAPVLFCGESGTAKTVTIQNFFLSLDLEQYLTLNINFSSRTSSIDVQRVVEANVEKRPGNTFGPPINKKLIIFIDDLNMPQVDTYGTQQPLALLKFLIERSALYGRGEDLSLKSFKDLMYIAAMAPPGGGRNPVDPRVVAMYTVFCITFPSEQALSQIYNSILTSHLQNGFTPDVQGAGAKMAGATMQLYKDLVANLPPTPSKFHYIFNLRDLSRVVEGVLLSTPDKFERGAQLVRLWRNECLRVFHDRLITPEDRAYVKDNLVGSLVSQLWRNEAKEINAEPILFGDYRNANVEGQPRLYEDMNSYAEVRAVFDEALINLNEASAKKMNLVLFQDALEHVTRIHRIMRMPRGNALLVGVGGSGKQSLTRLAAHAARYQLFEIQLTRGYGESEFREDLKRLYNLLGTEKGGSPVVFLFTDAHIKKEGFLELINNMLTSGIVPALFADEEKGPHLDAVRPAMTAKGLPISKETCWNYWVNRCRDNLHIVLCMSPAGENLRRRCRSFPGLVNNTVIDWFFPWPEEALQAVAQHFLSSVDLPEQHRQGVVDLMVTVHQSVQSYSDRFETELRRLNSVTPKNYLDLIETYRQQLGQFRTDFGQRYKRLDGGLTKLIEAAADVDAMRVDLEKQQIVVDQKSKECSEMIAQITERTTEVKTKQQMAMEKNEELQTAQVNVEREKGEAETALAEALPALAQAGEAVKNLDRGEIAVLKTLKAPPEAVVLVFQCVLELRPTPDVDPKEGWKGAQRMMSDASFLKRLLEYDKDGITPKMAKACASILYRPVPDPTKELNTENVQKVSSAAKGLLVWVIAVLKYHEIFKNVLPKQKLVKDLERSMAQGTKELGEIKTQLEGLQAEVSELTRAFTEKNDELQDLKEKADRMERQLTTAAKLIDGLGSERARWTKDREELEARKGRLVGDCMLTSAFLSYTGAFTFEFRYQMIYVDWLNACTEKSMPLSTPFKLESLLVSEVEISRWTSEGLPADELSVQNGILTTRASRFPLCIDPQMQASKWIKERESRNKKLSVHTFNDSDFAKRLELCIQFGNPFIFEGVEEDIDPLIDPVLEKAFVMRGNQRVLMLGDKEVEWDPEFRLYLITKMANPRYSPEVAGKTMIINYMVTMQGLEDQLLNVVVGFEQAKLQQTREELIQTMSENNRILVELENMLLKELTEATGNLLDNANLIATLESAKSKSVSIGEQMVEMRQTAEEIEQVTAGYRPVAKRGSILYFSMAGLSVISKMYEHSLAAYLDLFMRALRQSDKDTLLPNRLNNIIKKLTKVVYDYVCMGVFEKHKLMYSFQMTTMIMAGDNQLQRAELDFFLKGNLSLAAVSAPRPAEWVSESGWKDLHKLVDVSPEFSPLITQLVENLEAWKAWYDLELPEQADLPGGLSAKLTPFQHLLVYRCFRPDRVYDAVKRFVVQVFKTNAYVVPPLLNFEAILAQSSPTQPVVFILSPGADPMAELTKLAAVKIGLNKFRYVALGQGQAPIAMQCLEQGVARGYWVVLQNCHLMTSWLRQLEKILDTVKTPHADFRLWMTTDSTPNFPIGILQRSFKVVTEPPDGLMLNMKSSFSKVTQEVLDDCPNPAFRPLVYVLTFFHAVVQERRKYGKVGWNVPYDFNESDYDVSLKLLSMYLTKAHTESKDGVLPWGSLRYLIGEAMYGGRVTDAFDRRLLVTYLSEYMGDFLFDDNNPFYLARVADTTLSEKFRVPLGGGRDSYERQIDDLPSNCSPEVFGLHYNAQIGYSTNAAKDMWRELVDLQPRTVTAASGVSREEYIAKIARDVKEQVPAPFDLLVVRRRFEDIFQKRGEADIGPTSVVLLQEIERWNRLVEKMAVSLSDLARALTGEMGMSNELDELATSLYNGQLPNMWRKLAPRTLKMLGSWMLHFRRRYDQYKQWIDAGVDPNVIWLSGLHIPESYLTALVQTTCRRKRWPLDKSIMYTSVTKFVDPKEVKERPADGCYVTGLYLEGASWSNTQHCLRRQDPKVLVVNLPILQVIPIEAAKLKKQNVFETPVYVTQDRGNAMGVGFVFKADLTTFSHASHWVLQGCALVLNIDT